MEEKVMPVTIYTESSPNPNSLKFVSEFPLIQGKIDFPDKASAEVSPLATGIFENFDFVERVFIAVNFVTVTQSGNKDWYEVAPPIKDFIKAHLEAKKPILTKDISELTAKETPTEVVTEDSETVAKIKVVLDDYVRPAVESDGGAISFHSFNDGIVKVLLQGSCSGCPSSTITLKSGIESLLKKMVPEVTEVVAEGV